MVMRRHTMHIRATFMLMGVLFFHLAAAPYATAESETTVELELYNALARTGTEQWSFTGGGEAALSLVQTGNRSVRSSFDLSLRLLPTAAGSPDAAADVSRAYAKFRHEQLVGVIGKAPFSWGEGTMFNAAQSLFGTGLNTRLAQTEFEENAAWLTDLTWYTGTFSFVELLVLPPVIDTTSASPSPGSLWETRLGARWVAKAFGLKTEVGYLLDGRSADPSSDPSAGAFTAADYYHRPYVSLQGNLWIDWHLSASLEIPEEDVSADALQNGSLLTGGLYSRVPVGYDDTLNLRLEGRLRPWAQWQETHTDSTGSGDYGFFAYGELGWNFGTGFSLVARSQFSPVDLSARFTPGFSWNLFQGFTLFGFATVQAGDKGDLYPWKPGAESKEGRESGFSVLAGCSVIY